MVKVFSGAQCRMARGLLKWSVGELAERSGVSTMTIKRIESVDGIPTNSQLNTLSALYDAFMTSGRVRFEGETVVEAITYTGGNQ